jgi:hypothetical protein
VEWLFLHSWDQNTEVQFLSNGINATCTCRRTIGIFSLVYFLLCLLFFLFFLFVLLIVFFSFFYPFQGFFVIFIVLLLFVNIFIHSLFIFIFSIGKHGKKLCGHIFAALPCLISKPILLTDKTAVQQCLAKFSPKALLVGLLNVIYRHNLSSLALTEIEKIRKLRTTPLRSPEFTDRSTTKTETNNSTEPMETTSSFTIPRLDEEFVKMYSLNDSCSQGKNFPNLGKKISCGVIANSL